MRGPVINLKWKLLVDKVVRLVEGNVHVSSYGSVLSLAFWHPCLRGGSNAIMAVESFIVGFNCCLTCESVDGGKP